MPKLPIQGEILRLRCAPAQNDRLMIEVLPHFIEKILDKRMLEFGSIDELVEFFDTHDMGDYWDQMPKAHFDVDITKRTHELAPLVSLRD